MKSFIYGITAAFFLSASTASFAEPCNGISKDESVKTVEPFGVDRILYLDKIDVEITEDYLFKRFPQSYKKPDHIESAVQILFIDGSAGEMLFDKDNLACSATLITKEVFEEFEKILDKSSI
jgi:hypothetical protein